jgi:hypothetical protein
LEEARSEAEVILQMRDGDVQEHFFREAMRRNLSRTVRHLDRLVESGGADRDLGERALKRLGFATTG